MPDKLAVPGWVTIGNLRHTGQFSLAIIREITGVSMHVNSLLSKSFMAALLAAALVGCGGGGDEAVVPLQVGVFVAGQAQPAIYAGQPANLSMFAGQSVELDANEPVQWNFSVNGSPLFASGTTVIVQGVTITQSDLSPSRVVIDTTFNGPTQLPIFVTLTATSTIDLAQVAAINLTIR